MGATPKYALPYPEAPEPADVPVDTRELAERVEAVLAAAEAREVPVGSPIPWLTATIPTGYLEFNGQAIPAATYPQLAAVYGANLPDLRGRFLFAADASHGVGSVGGEETHQLSVAEMPAHTHVATTIGYATGPGGSSMSNLIPPHNNVGSGVYLSQGISPTGGGSAHNNMPPYRAARWITRAA